MSSTRGTDITVEANDEDWTTCPPETNATCSRPRNLATPCSGVNQPFPSPRRPSIRLPERHRRPITVVPRLTLLPCQHTVRYPSTPSRMGCGRARQSTAAHVIYLRRKKHETTLEPSIR